MTFGSLIIVLLVVGIALAYFKVDGQMRNLIIFVCAIAVLFALLSVFGVLDAGIFGRTVM